MENETTASEQLEKLIALQKKTLRQSRIAALAFLALMAVAAVAVAFALPKLLTLVARANNVLAETEILAVKAGEVLAETEILAVEMGDFMEETRPLIREANGLVANANGIILENTEAVADAVEKLNDINIERLNDAIDGLASAIQPMARLGELFSR